MNHLSKKAGVLLIGIVLMLVLTLAACSPSKTTSPATATPLPTGLFSSLLPTATAVPTEAPVKLEGAITTADGLQYLETKPGTGPAPEAGNVIKMDFIVTLADGTELVNTHKEGQPAVVVWGRNILLPGWEEAIGLMKEGGSAKVVVPPALAFGEAGSGSIPPNAQLVMEIDLLSVKPAPTPKTVSGSQFSRTASGLLFYDLVVGAGTEAITKTIVSTDYTIWVHTAVSDTYVTSSEGATPMMFTLGRRDTVFPGWEEGVQGMKVGGTRQLIVPPELALGSQSSSDIPANSTLLMEITLTDVHQPQVPATVNESNYTTTATGLKYYDLKVGTGATPAQGQTVVLHYTGWLSDGTQFDSSVDRATPFSFVLGAGNVIPGMDEGVQGMQVGGKRQLVIPPDLAYGSTGSGSSIPPNATLIFEVELLEIK